MRVPAALLTGLLLVGTLGAAPLREVDRLNAGADLDFVLDHVSQLYYGRTSFQVLLDGERAGLTAYLKSKGVVANLPALRAVDRAEARAQAQAELALAVSRYGSRADALMLGYAASKGVASALNDPYTAFFTPAEYRSFNSALAPEQFSGTGIIVQSEPASGFIGAFDVLPGGPADRAGVQQDDLLIRIDGHDTKNLAIKDASALLRGAQNTKVHVELKRGTHLLSVDIPREAVRPATVIKHLLPDGVGYIGLSVFGVSTAHEFDVALERLQQNGARAYVIDVRNNGGGYVNAALAISSKFIGPGALVSTQTRGGKLITYFGDNQAIAPKPLVILANAYSASASEITIGALQDSGVATVLGTKTFGKGVMQNLYPLPDGSAIKITVAHYFTPKNHDINHVGIAPDVRVSENANPAYGNPAHDAQLAAALAIIEQRLSKV